MNTVLICDDQEMVREGLQVLIESEPTFRVVGKAANGRAAVELAKSHQPDLILMDLRMPEMDGVEATRRIKAAQPEIPILVLTTYAADEWIFAALEAGANGYLLKDTPRRSLLEAMRGTLAGGTHLDPQIAGKVVGQLKNPLPLGQVDAVESLSQRELEVLRLVGQGFLNRDIARQLGLSEGTVRNYISSILGKLQLADRTQAAVFALRNGIAG